jgi:hypothetical protein
MADGPAPSAGAVARIDHTLGSAAVAGAKAPLMPNLAPPEAATLAALAAAKPGPCNFEIATLTPSGAGEATFTGSGWISELESRITSPQGLIVLSGPTGAVAGSVRVDSPRPDVSAYFKNPNGRLSGFAGTFFVPKLAPGAYTATAYRRAGPGWISCQAKALLEMR